MASMVKMKFTFAPESRPLDGYTIKRAIHRGGFGEVYYALSDSGREVALKLLQHNTDVELRGVQQCLNLSHPNLVTIFDVRRDNDGDHWILMEYVSGDTLDAVIRKHPHGLPLQQVLKWVNGIVAGTEYLHSRGIVHRDLKPGNVFSEGEHVKVGDIGLSKFITHSRRSAQTQSVGTVYYMAPEIAKGRYGKEVDVYALGVMVYEMLTGELPFDGESTGEILMKHLTEPPDLAKVPPALRSVLAKALEKDPAKRYSSMVSFGEAFAAAAVGKKIPEGKPVPVEVEPKPKKVKEELPSWVSVGPSAPPERPAKRPVPKPDAPSIPPLSWQLSTTGWGVLLAIGIAAFLLAARASSNSLVTWVMLIPVGLVYVWMLILRTAPFPAVQQLAGPFFLTPGEAAQRPVSAAVTSGRRLIGQYVFGAALAVPVAALLSAGMWVVAPSTMTSYMTHPASLSQSGGLDWTLLVYFTAGTVLTTWTILTIPVLSRLGTGQESKRRLPYAFAALGLSLVVWQLSEYLFIKHYPGGGIFEEIGDHRLFSLNQNPTYLGFVGFFLPLLAFRKWRDQHTPTRRVRFSTATVIGTVVLAWLISHVFAFPHFLAASWAATVSITVQLCSPWYERVPPRPARGTRVEETA